jgi:hypothetical protein
LALQADVLIDVGQMPSKPSRDNLKQLPKHPNNEGYGVMGEIVDCPMDDPRFDEFEGNESNEDRAEKPTQK